jgi:hypothetical protein
VILSRNCLVEPINSLLECLLESFFHIRIREIRACAEAMSCGKCYLYSWSTKDESVPQPRINVVSPPRSRQAKKEHTLVNFHFVVDKSVFAFASRVESLDLLQPFGFNPHVGWHRC